MQVRFHVHLRTEVRPNVWLTAPETSLNMPFRQEIQFLRDRARRLRQMANSHRTALSDQLRVMAAELEARSDELQRIKISRQLEAKVHIGRNTALFTNVNRSILPARNRSAMVWGRSTIDANTDPAAPAVIAAFEAAERAGLSTRECYKAGVEVWRQVHPDHAATYAAQQAVEVILRAKVSLRVEA